ncbi:MAG: DNA cytosine methyltransferase [candidate division Zixibacteria bacterium]|nr:DNA cytosine methyltransferase [candidate division Zixibacteria bacterium]
MKLKSMNAIDLFCGCGGATTGLKMAGFNVLGAVDIDSLAIETYTINHPEVSVWNKDITSLSPFILKKELNLKKGELDLLTGCPPCQGFSVIRTLNGSKNISDSRNGLLFNFLYYVELLKPKAVLFENVVGIKNDEVFDLFKIMLGNLGYFYKTDILDANDFGVPQRRKRLILIGSTKNDVTFAKRDRININVGDAIKALLPPIKSKDILHNYKVKRSEYVKNLINMIPKNGGSRKDLNSRYQLNCHRKCNGFKDVYGRMSYNKPAPTITSGCTNPSKGRFLHPTQNRAITLREAAILQSFPKNYYFSLRKGRQGVAEMIGNALPPVFIMKLAKSIKRSLHNEG